MQIPRCAAGCLVLALALAGCSQAPVAGARGLEALTPTPLPMPPPQERPARQLDATAASALEPTINLLAKAHAPGAKPLGPLAVASFAGGDTLEVVVSVQPGKCYTAIGIGAPTITELDVVFHSQADARVVLAIDGQSGSQAIVGRAPACYRWALPVTSTVAIDMTAAPGNGLAALQVFER